MQQFNYSPMTDLEQSQIQKNCFSSTINSPQYFKIRPEVQYVVKFWSNSEEKRFQEIYFFSSLLALGLSIESTNVMRDVVKEFAPESRFGYVGTEGVK